MVVVACRVLTPSLTDTVVDHLGAHGIDPILVGTELLLFSISQTVIAHILQVSRTTSGGEGVGLVGLHRDLSPLGGGERVGTVDGHATLVEFLTVVQNVLADLTKVDVKVTGIVGGGSVLTGIDKRIEQPELDIFDVCLFKIVGIKLTHHTTPLRLGLLQRTVWIEVGRQVIRSSLLGVIGQVEHGQRRGGTVVGTLLTVRIEFLHVDLAHIVVRQLIQVTLDMAGRQGGAPAGEDGVDVIPRQQRTVITTRHTYLVARFYEGRWHTREYPLFRVAHVDIVLRILEVVDIRGVVLCATGSTRDEMRKLTGKRDVRGFLHV